MSSNESEFGAGNSTFIALGRATVARATRFQLEDAGLARAAAITFRKRPTSRATSFWIARAVFSAARGNPFARGGGALAADGKIDVEELARELPELAISGDFALGFAAGGLAGKAFGDGLAAALVGEVPMGPVAGLGLTAPPPARWRARIPCPSPELSDTDKGVRDGLLAALAGARNPGSVFLLGSLTPTRSRFAQAANFIQ